MAAGASDVLTRVCTKCKAVKPINEFSAQSHGKYGVRSQCKVCTNQWREANRERIREWQKTYTKSHAERIAARLRAYRKANPHLVKKWRKASYAAHACRDRQLAQVYRKAHPDRIRERCKAYYEANGERIRERNKVRVEFLADAYIANLLARRSAVLHPMDILKELIECKRPAVPSI
jgi:hypothetical protein